MIYTSSSKTEQRIFLKKIKFFWQENEGVIVDDDNFVGSKSSLCLSRFSRKRTVSVSFISFEKYELPMRKFFPIVFLSSFFGQKHRVWKKKLTSFLGQKVAYKTLVQFTKPWILYSVSVLRSRGSNFS